MKQQTLFGDNALDESIDLIQRHCSGKGEIFIGFSGGKDSVCTAEVARLAGIPHRLFYSFTETDLLEKTVGNRTAFRPIKMVLYFS